MLGWAFPIRCGTTPAAVYAEPWLTSAASSEASRSDLDQLAVAGAVAVAQRGEDADGGEQPRQDVDQCDADLLRLAAGLAGDAHQTAEGLHSRS